MGRATAFVLWMVQAAAAAATATPPTPSPQCHRRRYTPREIFVLAKGNLVLVIT
jgi:hypothetical protein